jgi:uncharacterized membrane protein YhaH (DUF805 family)
MRISNEFSTAGRLTRAGFWFRHLTTVPLALWLSIGVEQLLGAPADLAFALLTLVLLVSIWGRRLHDRGHSAWWLLAAAIPVIGALGLAVECALRGTSARADRHGAHPLVRADYLSVTSSDLSAPAP